MTSKQPQRRLWRPFTFLLWNYTKVFARVTLDAVLYLPGFLLEQGEHNEPCLQPLHLLQHKSTSVVNTPIPMSSWIFIFNIAENLDFTSPSQHIRNGMLQFSLLMFSWGSKVEKFLSQINQLYFQFFYHRWIYKLNFRKISQNLLPTIMVLSLKSNCKSIADIFWVL